MAKVIFGEYAAFDTQGGIRFQKNSKLVSEKSIPSEVVNYLRSKLEVPQPDNKTKFPPPTEEEKAQMRAESQQVPPQLERSEEEMAEARRVPIEQEQDPLTEADFDLPPAPPAPASVEPTPAEAPLPSITEEMPQGDTPGVNVSRDPADLGGSDMSEFMEKVSIHTASVFDIAEALYNRFGLYTVYLGRLPVADEVNPLTGELFSKYHHGIAYQAAIRARHTGVLNRPAEFGRAKLDEGRAAAENLPLDTPPQTMGEARRNNSFAFRTSVKATQNEPSSEIIHVRQPDGTVKMERREIPAGEIGKNNGAAQRFDAEEDAPIVEPQLGKKVIRPNWAN